MKKPLFPWFTFISILLFSSLALAEDVKVGVLYPLTGPAAQAGIDAKIACELAADIINTGKYKNLNVPLSKTGLSNFKGGKLVLAVADHQGKPDLGLSEAERLISQEKVNAVLGCYHSAVTETASMVAERMKVPFFAPESSSPKLSRRGFKWFFRSSPHDETFSEGMFQCVAELSKKRNIKFQTIAVIYEDTLYGKDSSRIESELAAKAGYKVVADIAYRRGATSLTSEVLKLKAANPDILFPTSYAPDAILLTKTSKELDYNPKMVMAQNSGHTDPTFTEALGKDVDGISSRTEFSLDLAKAKPLVKEVNDLFKARSGRDFSGTSARAFVGMLVLAEAINRAGSTKPEAIQEALKKTNIPADQLITPWRGVKFDETGQNILVDAIVVQYSEAKQHTVWPFNLAAKDLVYPIPRWSERK